MQNETVLRCLQRLRGVRPLDQSPTDTELIQIKSGSLSVAGGTSIPPVNAIINQGGKDFITSGTQITPPLTTLLKTRWKNDLAQAELTASREKAELTRNDVALAVIRSTTTF
jgi:hypothetical protein